MESTEVVDSAEGSFPAVENEWGGVVIVPRRREFWLDSFAYEKRSETE